LSEPNDGLVEVTLPSGEVARVDPIRAAWHAEQAAKGRAAPKRPEPPLVVEVTEEEPHG
jgi:hypothetical protein